jgi:hypothetical protein
LDEDAAFTTLRAKGGFLVSASLRGGVVTDNVSIVSEAGEQVALFSPWGAAMSVVDAGTQRPVGTVRAGSVEGTVTWATTKGAEYTVSKKAAATEG